MQPGIEVGQLPSQSMALFTQVSVVVAVVVVDRVDLVEVEAAGTLERQVVLLACLRRSIQYGGLLMAKGHHLQAGRQSFPVLVALLVRLAQRVALLNQAAAAAVVLLVQVAAAAALLTAARQALGLLAAAAEEPAAHQVQVEALQP